MKRSSDPTSGKTDGRRSDDIASLLFALAAALFVINTLPTFAVGFYQDDFKSLNVLQDWGWSIQRALLQAGYEQGFRPLTYALRLLVWNIVGERVFVHRLILVSIHVCFGWILFHAARLLGGTRLHAAAVLVVYYASTITRATLYSYSAFFPADVLALGAVLVMLVGVDGNWSPRKLGLWTLTLAAAAMFSKETGLAASIAVTLLTIFFWKKLTARHKAWLLTAHGLLLLMYMGSYMAVTSGRSLTLAEFSLTTAQVQARYVFRGAAISLGGPFSAIYLSLRAYDFAKLTAAAIALLAALSATWLIWSAHGGNVRQVFEALRARTVLGAMIALLVIVFLAPNIPGRWFENRMLVGTFGMGALFWGVILGDALHTWANLMHTTSPGRVMWGVSIVAILAAFMAGSPLPRILIGQERTAERMREIVREVQKRGEENICLVGFPSEGSFLRISNARGVVGYESQREITAHSFSGVGEIPNTLNCVVVGYDVEIINEIPLVIEYSTEG